MLVARALSPEDGAGLTGPAALAASALGVFSELLMQACAERLPPTSGRRNRPRRPPLTDPWKLLSMVCIWVFFRTWHALQWGPPVSGGSGW